MTSEPYGFEKGLGIDSRISIPYATTQKSLIIQASKLQSKRFRSKSVGVGFGNEGRV